MEQLLRQSWGATVQVRHHPKNEEDFKMAALSEESYSLKNIPLFAFNVTLYNNYHLYILG